MKSHPFLKYSVVIMAVVTATVAHAAKPEPGVAFYRDSFTLAAGKTSGAELAGMVEKNTTGAPAVWTGFWPSQFKYEATPNGARNAGSAKGALAVTGNDGTAFSALLPYSQTLSAAPKLIVSVDIVPAPASSSKPIAMQWGLLLAQHPQDNFFATPGNIRIGIAREKDGGAYFVRAEQRSGNSARFAAPSALSDWVTLRVEFAPATLAFEIYVNEVYVGDFVPAKPVVFEYIGLEAVQQSETEVVSYFDNFTVSAAKP